jgi:hypothetical protein
MIMLGASTSLGSQRCNTSKGETFLNAATELMVEIRARKK